MSKIIFLMTMITINIAKDFTDVPGARNYEDGPKSGQEFFEKLLKARYQQAVQEGVKLQINMDGTNGYPSSFINEAFRLLGKLDNPDVVWSNLIIVSNEVPKYARKVKESIYEK